MTESFTLIASFLKELVRHGLMHLFSGIGRLDTAICNVVASLLIMFAPPI